jgi:hypothetical protein
MTNEEVIDTLNSLKEIMYEESIYKSTNEWLV